MIILRASVERRVNAAFSAGEGTAFRGLLFRPLERAPQVSDFDPPIARHGASFRRGGHDDDAIANT
jgi:hypothetical protein